MTAAALPLQGLDDPLPVELAGQHHGWFTRYRRYPVFSRPWARGRLQVVGSLTLAALVVLIVPTLLATRAPEAATPLGGLAQLTLAMLLPVWLGPLLAGLVRRRGWEARREWAGLVSALAATVLLMLVFAEWGSEPLKQWIAEQQGSVDAQGKRKRIVMSLGLSLSDPSRPAPTQPPGPPAPPEAEGQDIPALVRLSSLGTLALLTFLLAGGSALWGWRREVAGLAALARERELTQAQHQRREAELRLSVLAAQVEPHFLFNTVAGVRSAIATDPARASDMIDRLVDYLRAAIPRLRSDGRVQATVGAQLDIARAYLGLMSARMPRLQWDVQALPALHGARCPPLMLISLTENAIKHGVERKVGPARIELRVEQDGPGHLQLSVLDDGPGFQPTGSGSGLGLTNIRERLAQLYGDAASLTLKARPEGGVAATLRLPLEFDAPTRD